MIDPFDDKGIWPWPLNPCVDELICVWRPDGKGECGGGGVIMWAVRVMGIGRGLKAETVKSLVTLFISENGKYVLIQLPGFQGKRKGKV